MGEGGLIKSHASLQTGEGGSAKSEKKPYVIIECSLVPFFGGKNRKRTEHCPVFFFSFYQFLLLLVLFLLKSSVPVVATKHVMRIFRCSA